MRQGQMQQINYRVERISGEETLLDYLKHLPKTITRSFDPIISIIVIAPVKIQQHYSDYKYEISSFIRENIETDGSTRPDPNEKHFILPKGSYISLRSRQVSLELSKYLDILK